MSPAAYRDGGHLFAVIRLKPQGSQTVIYAVWLSLLIKNKEVQYDI